MLMHFSKDLKNEAMAESESLFKEGVEIAKSIGLQLSDHKLEVLVQDSKTAYLLKKDCQNEIEENADDYLTVDVRLRSNSDRSSDKDAFRIELYGNETEILNMTSHIIGSHDSEKLKINPIEKCTPRVPGFIDGDSFQRRKEAKKRLNKDVEFSPSP
jgi:hypothetical protein